MQGTGKSAAAGPELGDSIKMTGRVVLEVLLMLHSRGRGGAWGKDFCLARRTEVSSVSSQPTQLLGDAQVLPCCSSSSPLSPGLG